MLVKILGYVMIVICTTGFGILAGQRLNKRVKELEMFIVVVKNINYELNFNQSTPTQIISAVSSNNRFTDFEPLKLCNEYCRRGEPFYSAWEQAVERGATYINKDDKQLISSLSQIIGANDMKSQNDSLLYYQNNLSDTVLVAKEYSNSHYKLYNTLGILLGVFIVLLLL